MADPRDVVLDVPPEEIRKITDLEASITEWSVRFAMLDQQMTTVRAQIRGLMEAKTTILSAAMTKAGIVAGQVAAAEVDSEGRLVLKVVGPSE